MQDQIRLSAIRVSTHIGVPDEERAQPQSLEVDLTLVPVKGFAQAGDELEGTIDYFSVWQRVHEIAGEKPRKLIETLAEELANAVLKEYEAVAEVGVVVRKFILPQTGSVSVTIWRERHIVERKA